jgi:hypothetical protein
MKITAKKIIETALEVLDQEPQMIETGCYPTLPNETYHAMKSHLSRSSIMDYDKCPYTYWAKHINPDRPQKDATPQMELGTAFHTLILEPERFDQEYVMKPAQVLLKDVGREAYDKYKGVIDYIEKSGQKVLSFDDWHNLMAMKARLESNEQAMEAIRDARIEHSFFWQDEHSGLLLKCRPDILHSNMIVDLKTCSDASPRAYQSEMVKYGYHVQGAMIRDGVEAVEGHRISNVINICVETKYPHNMAIYIIDEHAIDEGEVKYKNILLDLKNAIGHNTYQDYGIQTIGLPRWAM